MFQKQKAEKQVSGPTGLEVASWYYQLLQEPFQTFLELNRRYGDVVRFPIRPNRAVYWFSKPEQVKYVLQDNHRNYSKAMTYDFLRPVVGNGLLTSEGDFWLRQRRLVAPMFHRKRVVEYGRTMLEMVEDFVEQLGRDCSEPIDIAAEMARLTLSIAGKILFNRDIRRDSDRIGSALKMLFRDINTRILSPLSIPRSVPTPHNRRLDRALESLESVVYDLIDERRGREREYDDLLSMLMLAEDDETGKKMTDKQVRDEVMTFILAGHETTSNALTWCFYLLSQFPAVRRRLEDEVDRLFDPEQPLTSIREMTYIEQVFDETTRLYPPAWTIEREPREDDLIDGYRVPAGSIVVVAPYFVHHNSDVWPNPEGFDPGRFAPSEKESHHRYAHFPFGGGPRMCVGADFAVLEAKIVLALVTRHFRLDLAPGQQIEPEATVTLYPANGVDVIVRPR